MGNESYTTNDKIWAIDLDRTLLHTGEVMASLKLAILSEVASRIDISDIEDKRKEVEVAGGSFDAFECLKTFDLSEDQYKRVTERFVVSSKRDSLIYSDAIIFLSYINSLRLPNIIMTTGGQEFQSAKLRAAGLQNQPHIITDRQDKGRLIAEAWDSDKGVYRFQAQTIAAERCAAVIVGKSVALVDDKIGSFIGLPDDCEGYLIGRPSSKFTGSDLEKLPAQVKIAKSLSEVPVTIDF